MPAMTSARANSPSAPASPPTNGTSPTIEACQDGVAQVEAELGPVDVLVNNAGITRDTTMKRMDHQKWQEVIDTNLGGCFNMAKAVFEGMQARGYGRIVNIGSINGQAGPIRPGQLCRRQVGHPRLHQGAGAGRRAHRRDRQRHRAGLYRHRHGRRGPAGSARQDRRARSRSTASARPTRSPAASPSWSTRMRGFVTGSTLSINGGQHMY